MGVVVGLIIADYGHLRFRMIQSTRSAKKANTEPKISSNKPLTTLRAKIGNNS